MKFPPASDEQGVWVPVAAILIIGVMMMSLTIYITLEIPRIRREQEHRQSQEIKDALMQLQQSLQDIQPGEVVGLQILLAPRPVSPYMGRARAGTISATESQSSAIGVTVHDSYWDFKLGKRDENLDYLSDVLRLDNYWEGNWFAADSSYISETRLNNEDKKVSFRFVAQRSGTVGNVRVYVYKGRGDDPQLTINYTYAGQTTSVTLYPTDDAYVREDDAGTNFETSDPNDLEVKSKLDEDRRAYLKFDLSIIPDGATINSAQLSAYCRGYQRDNTAPDVWVPFVVAAYSVTADGWQEETITWNTSTGYPVSSLATADVDDYGWYDWGGATLTNFVNDQRFGGGADNIASFSLSAETEDDPNKEWPYAIFHAKDIPYNFVLKEDDGTGKPGAMLGTMVTMNVDNSGWVVVQGLNAGLTTGEVYHLVIQNEDGASSWRYISPNTLSPRNDVWVGGAATNENRTVLVWDLEKNVWWEYEREPVYILDYTSPSVNYDGNHYANYWRGYLQGDQTWGENFLAAETIEIGAVDFFVRKVGSPYVNLRMVLQNLTTGQTLVDVDFAAPDNLREEAGGVHTWFRHTLRPPLTLYKDNRYLLYFIAPGTTQYGYYRTSVLMVENTSFYRGLGWGGEDNFAVYSEDGGTSWENHLDKDLSFRLIRTGGHKTQGEYISPVLGSNELVRWLNLTWENEGAVDNVRVRLGNTPKPEDLNLPDDPDYGWTEWKLVANGQTLREDEIFGSEENRTTKYLQYRVRLSTTNPSVTPRVKRMSVRYQSGSGLALRQLPYERVWATTGDFRQGVHDNTLAKGGGVKLCVESGDYWESQDNGMPTPPEGVSEKNGDRITTMNDNIYMWVAWGGTDELTDEGSKKGFYLYNPSAGPYGTWETDWNASYTENAPFGSSYAITTETAVDPSGNPAVYIFESSTANDSQDFARWTESGGWENSTTGDLNKNVPWAAGVPRKFRNGVAAAWDNGNPGYIYVLAGSGYSYSLYDFYRYDIANDNWERIPADAPNRQGPGNALEHIVVDGGDYLYAVIGRYDEAQFWRFSIQNMEWNLHLDDPPYGADDASMLQWDGADFVYHTPGAYVEGLPSEEECHLMRYSISGDVWEELAPAPYNEYGGFDDGGGLALVGDYLYALKGGNDTSKTGYGDGGGGGAVADNFWRYRAPVYDLTGMYESQDFDSGRSDGVNWEQIEFDAGEPTGTDIDFEISFDQGASWVFFENKGTYTLDNRSRYLRFRVYFDATASPGRTPVLKKVVVRYTVGTPVNSWQQTDWSGDNAKLWWWYPSTDSTRYYDNQKVDGRIHVGDLILVPGDENYLWGDNFRVDAALGSSQLSNLVQRLSLRFRAQRSENVTGVRVYVDSYGADTTLALAIYADNSSDPGKPGEIKSSEEQVLVTLTGWLSVSFTSPAELVKDNVYHVVVRVIPTPVTGSWTQTNWEQGDGWLEWSQAYENAYYWGDNVDNTQAGKIRLENVATYEYGPGDNIVITEVLADVEGTETTYGDINEFIELYNRSDHTIDINGWIITDGDAGDTIEAWVEGTFGDITDSDVITETTSIPSGTYVVILDREYVQGGAVDPGNQPYDFPPDTIAVTVDDTTIGDGLTDSDVPAVQLRNGATVISEWTNCTDDSQSDGASVQMENYAAGNVVNNWGEPGGNTSGARNSGYVAGEIGPITTYKSPGWFTSSVYDAGNAVRWDSISWTQNVEAGVTSIQVYLRFDNVGPNDGPDNILGKPWQGPVSQGSLASLENRVVRYVQENVVMEATDNTKTPELLDITLNYTVLAGGGSWSQTGWTQETYPDLQVTTQSSGYENFYDADENIDYSAGTSFQLAGVSPPGQENYGNWFRVDSVNPIITLDSDSDVAGWRFTAQQGQSITGVRFYLANLSGSVTLKVKLHANDNAGNPGTVLAENTSVTAADGWVYAGLENVVNPASPVQLNANDVYLITVRRSGAADPEWQVQTDWSGENTGLPPAVVVYPNTTTQYTRGENENVKAAGLVRLENEAGVGGNLVQNPGFETGDLSNWTENGTAGKHVADTAQKHSGSYSCKFIDLTSSYSGRAIRSDAVSVTAGTNYSFGGWFYVPTETGGSISEVNFRCRIEWRDSSDTIISSYPGTTGWSLSAFDTWEKKEWTDQTAPDGAVTATLFIEARESNPLDYDPYIDDTEIIAPSGGGNYKPAGYLESSIFDAGSSVQWGNVSWNASTPSAWVGENYNPTIEPTTLVDDNSQAGTVTGGSIDNVKVQDGVYENIQEKNLGGAAEGIANHVVISEIFYDETGTDYNEFIELYNPTDSPISIGGWKLEEWEGGSPGTLDHTKVIPSGAVIQPHSYFLMGKQSPLNSADWGSTDIVPDAAPSGAPLTMSWVQDIEQGPDAYRLLTDADVYVDAISYGSQDQGWTDTGYYVDVAAGDSIERKSSATHDESQGNAYDTNNNANDFRTRGTPQPENSGHSEDPPTGPDNYQLLWEHRITGVDNTYSNYNLKIYGHTDATGENIGIYVWNSNTNSWEFIDNLLTSDNLITYTLTNINNYLVGDNLSIKYDDSVDDNTVADNIYIDYCALEAKSLESTSTKVYTRTGTDNNPYLGNGDPDTDNWCSWVEQENNTSVNMENRYLQCRIEENTTDTSVTPEFYDITFNFTTVGVGQVDVMCSTPNNLMRPKDNSSDTDLRTYYSTNGGGSWENADNQPIFVLEAATPEGNPYVSGTARTYAIYGSNYAGENLLFTPGADKQVVAIRVDNIRKMGYPSDLMFTVINENTEAVVENGLLKDNDDPVWAGSNWVSVENTSVSFTLINNYRYRFYLWASVGDSGNYYEWRTLSTGADIASLKATTYGGTNSTAWNSLSGDNAQRDVRFKFTFGSPTQYKSPGVLTSSVYDAGSVVTWGQVTYSTSGSGIVTVEARVDNSTPPATAWQTYVSGTSINKDAQYTQYRVTLQTPGGDNTATPVFGEISISYSGGTAGTVGQVRLRVSQPRENKVPYNQALDENQQVLFYDGTGWTEDNRQPVYVLDWWGGAYGGNPYAENTAFEVRGSGYFGERITVTDKTKVVHGFYAYVKRKGGIPEDDLYYRLESLSDPSYVRQGYISKDDVGADWDFVGAEFDDYLMVRTESYRLSLYSPSTTQTTAYLLLSPSTENSAAPYANTTFDGTNSVAWTSSAGENSQRDALFMLICADNFRSGGWLESSVYDAGENVDWRAALSQVVNSAGSSATVRIRVNTTAGDNNPYDGSGWSGWQTVSGSIRPPLTGRYVQYCLNLTTSSDNSTTPVFRQLTLQYQQAGTGADTPPRGAMLQTWRQTMYSDFIGSRTPDAIGTDVEAVAPGDLTLKASSYWGNPWVSDSSWSTATKLTDNTKRISIRFVAQRTENVENLRLWPYKAGQTFYWRVELRDDSNGLPGGLIAENTGVQFKHDPEDYWRGVFVHLNQVAQLVEDNVYHIIVQAAADNFPNTQNYANLAATKPSHDNWVDGTAANENRTFLFYDGERWGELVDRELVYILEADTDGNGVVDFYDGNPYRRGYAGAYPEYGIFSTYWAGQQITMPADIPAAAVEFFMQQGGEPNDLYFGIDDITEQAVRAPYDIPSEFNWGWVRSTFKNTRTLWENDSYTLYVRSPWSDAANCDNASVMKTITDYEAATWVGANSQYVYSYGGVSWIPKSYWDMPFRIITGYPSSGTFESEWFDAGQVVDWRYIQWDSTEPPGTSVTVQVRTSTGGGWQTIYKNSQNLDGVVQNSRRIQYRITLTGNGNVSPAVHEVRISYRGGFGSLRLETGSTEFARQTWLYEGGAVILAQDNRSLMHSAPSDMIIVDNKFENGSPLPPDTLRVSVNLRLLMNRAGIQVGGATGTQRISFFMPEEAKMTVEPGSGPNEDSLDIVVVTDYPEAWYGYFTELSRELNRRPYTVNSSVSYYNPSGGEVRLTIQGPSTDTTSDIFYYKSVREIDMITV